jgi:hypothetical protein
MWWSFALNVLLGILMLITMLFCIGTLDDAVNAEVPYLQLFVNTGSNAVAFALTIILLVLIFKGEYHSLSNHQPRSLRLFSRSRLSILEMAEQDGKKTEHPIQLSLCYCLLVSGSLRDQHWQYHRVQHHHITYVARLAQHIHVINRMCLPEADQRTATPTSEMESGSIWTCDQRVCICLLGLRHSLQLFPRQLTGRYKHGKLGASCMGRCDAPKFRHISTSREETLHCACDVRRGDQDWSLARY